MHLSVKSLAFAFCAMVFVTLSHAHDFKHGDLVIDHSVIPATVASAPVAAGYMKITNNGTEADRLVSFETNFTGKESIHTMKMIDGVMKMRPLENGLEIPAGETVVLKRGGFHLMFMQLQEQMEAGQLREVVLNFERAGEVKVEMLVLDPADMEGDEMDHSNHGDHSGHSHSTN